MDTIGACSCCGSEVKPRFVEARFGFAGRPGFNPTSSPGSPFYLSVYHWWNDTWHGVSPCNDTKHLPGNLYLDENEQWQTEYLTPEEYHAILKSNPTAYEEGPYRDFLENYGVYGFGGLIQNRVAQVAGKSVANLIWYPGKNNDTLPDWKNPGLVNDMVYDYTMTPTTLHNHYLHTVVRIQFKAADGSLNGDEQTLTFDCNKWTGETTKTVSKNFTYLQYLVEMGIMSQSTQEPRIAADGYMVYTGGSTTTQTTILETYLVANAILTASTNMASAQVPALVTVTLSVLHPYADFLTLYATLKQAVKDYVGAPGSFNLYENELLGYDSFGAIVPQAELLIDGYYRSSYIRGPTPEEGDPWYPYGYVGCSYEPTTNIAFPTIDAVGLVYHSKTVKNAVDNEAFVCLSNAGGDVGIDPMGIPYDIVAASNFITAEGYICEWHVACNDLIAQGANWYQKSITGQEFYSTVFSTANDWDHYVTTSQCVDVFGNPAYHDQGTSYDFWVNKSPGPSYGNSYSVVVTLDGSVTLTEDTNLDTTPTENQITWMAPDNSVNYAARYWPQPFKWYIY